MKSPADNPGRRIPLAPPERFVTAARATMGGLDFDPWSTKQYNRLVLSRRYLDYELADLDIIAGDHWDIPAEGRLICAPPFSIVSTRRLLHRILGEYRKRTVKQACVLISAPEVACKLPWIWDFPAAMPFTRPSFRWYDEECEKFRSLATTVWSFVLYFPPCENQAAYQQAMARFYDGFSPFCRIVSNEFAGDTSWKQHYRKYFGREFQESR